MTDSISTFCVLGRHALVLSGHPPRWKKTEVVAALENAMGRPLKAANEILAIRAADKRSGGTEPVPLLEQYLAETDALVRFVDALER
jgi:hypothetical protein